MSKKHAKKQVKTTRKKYHHTHDATLPSIEVTPNLSRTVPSFLPKIRVDCPQHISGRVLRKITRRLQFADPDDFRYLGSVRLVAPSAITLPSKETTDACYYPKEKGREAEIWLSTHLFAFPGIRGTFLNLFILRHDRLFDAIFHELGHHKAHHIRLISNHKQEAYAEKYLQAYKTAWKQQNRWVRMREKLLDGLLALIFNRYVLLVYFYTLRKRNDTTHHVYQLYLQYVLRKITHKELWEQIDLLTPPRKQNKKKWTHPLQRQKYRDKFRLDR